MPDNSPRLLKKYPAEIIYGFNFLKRKKHLLFYLFAIIRYH